MVLFVPTFIAGFCIVSERELSVSKFFVTGVPHTSNHSDIVCGWPLPADSHASALTNKQQAASQVRQTDRTKPGGG